MPSNANFKARYRNDAAFRAAHNARTRARRLLLYAQDDRYRQLDAARKEICEQRQSIDYHMAEAERRDKRLLELIAERERLAEELRRAH